MAKCPRPRIVTFNVNGSRKRELDEEAQAAAKPPQHGHRILRSGGALTERRLADNELAILRPYRAKNVLVARLRTVGKLRDRVSNCRFVHERSQQCFVVWHPVYFVVC